jgi:hypothetical protein
MQYRIRFDKIEITIKTYPETSPLSGYDVVGHTLS